MSYLISDTQMERLKSICEISRNKKMLKELQELTPLENNDTLAQNCAKQSNSLHLVDNLQLTDHLQKARQTKQDKLMAKIKIAIDALKSENKPINAYQVHKITNIAYSTLKKHLECIK